MPVPSADKKTLSHRLRWLAVGTALAIAAIVGANALILVQLHHSTLRQVQSDLLRQSLDLSELVERTLQATDLMLISVAERASALKSSNDRVRVAAASGPERARASSCWVTRAARTICVCSARKA